MDAPRGEGGGGGGGGRSFVVAKRVGGAVNVYLIKRGTEGEEADEEDIERVESFVNECAKRAFVEVVERVKRL